MEISQSFIEDIVSQVIKMFQESQFRPEDNTALTLKEIGKAGAGISKKEVVVAIGPAFGKKLHRTIVGIPLATVLKELMSGTEEEGMETRVIRVQRTSDVAFMAHAAAKLSGSGISIGVQSRGTTIIHQKDLQPLNNLELFPQSPLLEGETYRAIGRNAARYAKGESPEPVPVKSDQMARPKYQAKAAVMHILETEHVVPKADPVEVQVSFG